MKKAEQTYARYVASKILEQISQAQEQSVAAAASTLSLQVPPVIPDLIVDDAAIASENEYAVYMMEIKGNEIGAPQVSIKDLPGHVVETMNRMSRTGLAADRSGMEDMLISLGASAGELFGKVDQAEVFTQVGDQFLKLQKLTPYE